MSNVAGVWRSDQGGRGLWAKNRSSCNVRIVGSSCHLPCQPLCVAGHALRLVAVLLLPAQKYRVHRYPGYRSSAVDERKERVGKDKLVGRITFK